MKLKYWLSTLVLVLVASLLTTSTVLAQTPTPETPTYQGDKVIIANTFRLQSGESLGGNLLVIGGTATLENNSTVNGDVVLIGGTITVNGTVNGDVAAIGGAATLGDSAVVSGDIVTLGASLKKSDQAKVTGTITQQTPDVAIGNGWTPPWKGSSHPLSALLTAAFESLALAAMAVVIALILPKQTQNVTDSVRKEALIDGAVGLIAIVGSPVLVLILVVTILLIPVAVLYILAFCLAFVFGWLSFGNFLGQRFASLFHATWPLPVSSGIGTLILSLVVGAVNLVPCLGWTLGFIIGLIGLGAVVATRFGSQKFLTKQTVVPPTAPAAPLPPQPPTA